MSKNDLKIAYWSLGWAMGIVAGYLMRMWL